MQISKNIEEIKSPHSPSKTLKSPDESKTHEKKSVQFPDKSSIEEKIKSVPWISQNFDTSTIKKLGSGGFGQVFEAQSLKDKKKVAIKFMHFANKEEMDSMEKEITIMSSLQRYGNIVKILDPHKELASQDYFSVMEKGDGTLHELILKHNYKIAIECFFRFSAIWLLV